MRALSEIQIDAPVCAVWAALTGPEHQNRWREQAIRGWLPGDGGAPGATGAVWFVDDKSMDVVSEGAQERRLVVHRTESMLFRDWWAEVTLTSRGELTTVRWSEQRETWAPGNALMARSLRTRVDRELGRLASVARTGPRLRAVAAAAPSFDADRSETAMLRRAAEACRDEQLRLADRLTSEGSELRFFARVYALLTARALQWNERMTHPGWALRLIPEFHRLYIDNVTAWERGDAAALEYHWLRAFLAMGDERLDPTARMMKGLMYAVEAHVDEDLPRALARVYLRNYAGQCDLDRFRADFVLLRRMFAEANDDFVAAIDPKYTPLHLRIAQRVAPSEVLEALRKRMQYDVGEGRLAAFERAKRLVAQLQPLRDRLQEAS